jgi:carbamoyltransferase
MNVLGISAHYHDAAAAIVINGHLAAAAQEERFSRKKHDPDFPIQAIDFCLAHTGLQLHELDAVAFYEKPLLRFERILETFYQTAPQGMRAFLHALPDWLQYKLRPKSYIRNQLRKIAPCPTNLKILFPEHHLSHAAAAFFASPFPEAAILTVDGVGEWATTAIFYGKEHQIQKLCELHFPDSPGLFYSAITDYLGFKINDGEYKVMGLAPYAENSSPPVQKIIRLLKQQVIHIAADGSIKLNPYYFSYTHSLKMTYDKRWEKLLGFPRRLPAQPLDACHCQLAQAAQHIIEIIMAKLAKTARQLANSDFLCLAGGVALNCVANGKLSLPPDKLFIQPAAGDAGGAIGAAWAAEYIYFQQPRTNNHIQQPDAMHGAYLGPEINSEIVRRRLLLHKIPFKAYTAESELIADAAAALAAGRIIGWAQGRMEFGPRALGARSILADPRPPEIQLKINQVIKQRESFRPFAPAILAEHVNNYFQTPADSYMLRTARLHTHLQIQKPADFDNFTIEQKLITPRSHWQSVTHIDYSARIQAVAADSPNKLFRRLLEAFYALTGCPCILNTSFNGADEPIVCTENQIITAFKQLKLDMLFIDRYQAFRDD